MERIDLRTQKQLAFQILQYLDTVCRAKHLTYYIAYGTLIGAVRHKGYIPWDDDIDVMMSRKDYDALIREFPEHPYYKIVDNSIDPNYCKSFAVINDTRTIKVENLLRKKCQKSVSINIDIFPYDPMPDDKKEQQILIDKIRKVENRLACISYAYGNGRNIFTTIRKNIGIFIYRFQEFLGLTSITKIINEHNRLMKSYTDIKSNTVACLANTGYSGIKEYLPKEDFDKAVELEFEGVMLLAPIGFDDILKKIYGDYMTPPPASDRQLHNSTCYWK